MSLLTAKLHSTDTATETMHATVTVTVIAIAIATATETETETETETVIVPATGAATVETARRDGTIAVTTIGEEVVATAAPTTVDGRPGHVRASRQIGGETAAAMAGETTGAIAAAEAGARVRQKLCLSLQLPQLPQLLLAGPRLETWVIWRRPQRRQRQR